MSYSGKVVERQRARELRAQSLHEGLDLERAIRFWSDLTQLPPSQFTKPYRARADPTIPPTKHLMGCPGIAYRSASIHRRVMGLIEAVLSPTALPG